MSTLKENPPQVGVFGGSFNPPHWGHIHLAIGMMEAHDLEEVWFCPAATSPHKQRLPQATAQDRLAMTILAVEGVPHCRVLDLECQRGGVSYTVDTLKELTRLEEKRSQPRQLRLLLGADSASTLDRWHQPEEILRLAPPLIAQRSGSPTIALPDRLDRLIPSSYTPLPLVDISSSYIRERLRSGLYCGHLLPGKTLDYIQDHHLY